METGTSSSSKQRKHPAYDSDNILNSEPPREFEDFSALPSRSS